MIFDRVAKAHPQPHLHPVSNRAPPPLSALAAAMNAPVVEAPAPPPVLAATPPRLAPGQTLTPLSALAAAMNDAPVVEAPVAGTLVAAPSPATPPFLLAATPPQLSPEHRRWPELLRALLLEGPLTGPMRTEHPLLCEPSRASRARIIAHAKTVLPELRLKREYDSSLPLVAAAISTRCGFYIWRRGHADFAAAAKGFGYCGSSRADELVSRHVERLDMLEVAMTCIAAEHEAASVEMLCAEDSPVSDGEGGEGGAVAEHAEGGAECGPNGVGGDEGGVAAEGSVVDERGPCAETRAAKRARQAGGRPTTRGMLQPPSLAPARGRLYTWPAAQ